MKQSLTSYEEIELTCIGCGKKVKTIKLKGRNINSFLCQRCGKS